MMSRQQMDLSCPAVSLRKIRSLSAPVAWWRLTVSVASKSRKILTGAEADILAISAQVTIIGTYAHLVLVCRAAGEAA